MFEQIFLPFLITILKLFIEVSCEITNVLITYSLAYDEVWQIMCYSAMTIIGTIDSQYFEVINDKLKDKLENEFEMALPLEVEDY